MKLLSNNKFIILFLALVSLSAYLVLVKSWQQGVQAEVDQTGKQEQAQTAAKHILPDFDQRKLLKAPQQQDIEVPEQAFKADEVLARSEQELDIIINEYNQVLDDPQARKVLEARMKETSKAYKQAILAKVRKGEI